MADRIKGITVEIGGDTTGLSKALSGVNKEIKSTQTQLKDVNKLLKLDPTNTTLLQQKQQLFQKMQGELATKRQEIFKGIKDKVDNAVSDVAKTKGLSLVVDKSVVLYGGTDITDQVAKELNKNSSSSSSDSSSSNSSSSDSSSSNQ